METPTETKVEKVSVARAAELAGVSRAAIYQWIEAGWLAVAPGTEAKTLVSVESLLAAKEKQGKGWRDKKNSRAATARSERWRRIKQAMKRSPFMPAKAIAEALGAAHRTVERDIIAMKRAGEIDGTSYIGWKVN